MFYRKDSNNIIYDFSASKYADDCLETQENIVLHLDGNYYLESELPDPTSEELLEQAKEERAEAVSKIIVEVDGMKFDGDETAQTRIGRTIAAVVALGVDINTYTQTWVLADNTVATPTIKQLAQALKLAGDKQTELWTAPYEEQSPETLSLAKVGI